MLWSFVKLSSSISWILPAFSDASFVSTVRFHLILPGLSLYTIHHTLFHVAAPAPTCSLMSPLCCVHAVLRDCSKPLVHLQEEFPDGCLQEGNLSREKLSRGLARSVQEVSPASWGVPRSRQASKQSRLDYTSRTSYSLLPSKWLTHLLGPQAQTSN